MGEIPTIGISNAKIVPIVSASVRSLDVPSINVWMGGITPVGNYDPSIITNIGIPIVDMPGCVKMHKDNKRHKNGLPIDKDLVEDDPDHAMTLCPDGSYPSYDAMNYEPEQLLFQKEQKPPPINPAPDAPTPETPDTGKVVEKDVECPGPGQPRIGDLSQSGDERVSGHELSEDGKICIVLYEPTTVVEKYLPPANVVSTTATIAVVATASAIFAKPLADLLLKVVKPAVKQVITKVQKLLGKTPEKDNRNVILANKYREKKGLPPLKKPKKKK